MIQFISDNKEWIFSGIGATILAIIIPIILKKKKPRIINKYNKRIYVDNHSQHNNIKTNNHSNNIHNTTSNNIQNNNSNNIHNTSSNNKQNYNSNNIHNNNLKRNINNKDNKKIYKIGEVRGEIATKVDLQAIELGKIRLYSTGSMGKVYSTDFHKEISHKFGIEVTLNNNSNTVQNVKVKWCIYDAIGTTIATQKFDMKVNEHSHLKKEFNLKDSVFNKLREGNYKSKVWINDKNNKETNFRIMNK